MGAYQDEEVGPPAPPPGYEPEDIEQVAPPVGTPPKPPLGYEASDIVEATPLRKRILARQGRSDIPGHPAGTSPGSLTSPGIGGMLGIAAHGVGQAIDTLNEPISAASQFLGKGLQQTVTATENAFPVVKPLTAPFEDEQGQLRPPPLREYARMAAGGNQAEGSSMLEQNVPGGIALGAAGATEELLTPDNLALMLGMAKLPKLASAALSGVFALGMGKSAFMEIPGVKDALAAHDYPLAAEIATRAAVSGTLALGAAGSAVRGGLEGLPRPRRAAVEAAPADLGLTIGPEDFARSPEPQGPPPPPPGYHSEDVRRVVQAHEEARQPQGEMPQALPQKLGLESLEMPAESALARLTLEAPAEPESIPYRPEKAPAERPETAPLIPPGREPEERIPVEATATASPLEPPQADRAARIKAYLESRKTRGGQPPPDVVDLTPEERDALDVRRSKEGPQPFGPGYTGAEAEPPRNEPRLRLQGEEPPELGSPEDLHRARYTSGERLPEAMIVPHNLEGLTEEFGPEAADQARRVLAGATRSIAAAANGEAFDTPEGFVVRAKSENQLRRLLEKMQTTLRDHSWRVRLKDGTEESVPVEAEYGVGPDTNAAARDLEARQTAREANTENARRAGLGLPEGAPQEGATGGTGARGARRADQLRAEYRAGRIRYAELIRAEREDAGLPPIDYGTPLSAEDWRAGKGAWLKAIARRKGELRRIIEEEGQGASDELVNGALEAEKNRARGIEKKDERAKDQSKVEQMRRISRSRNAPMIEEGRAPYDELAEKTAYHGSPYTFDRFDSSKIGSGEGAQSFGHGLYFSERRGVAEDYRKRLSGRGYTNTVPEDPIPHEIGGNRSRFLRDEIDMWLGGIKNGDEAAAKGDKAAVESYRRFRDEEQQAIRERFRAFDQDLGPTAPGADAAAFRALREWYERNERITGNQITRKKAGRLYTVGIPDDVHDAMLHWDKPLEEQPENVKRALQQLGFERIEKTKPSFKIIEATKEGEEVRPGTKAGMFAVYEGGHFDRQFPTREQAETYIASQAPRNTGKFYWESDGHRIEDGAEAYRTLAYKAGKKIAAERLRAAGVPGIRYYDQGSRGTGINDDLWHLARPDLNGRRGSGYISSYSTEAEARAAMAREIAESRGRESEADYILTPPKARTHNYVLFNDEHAKILKMEERRKGYGDQPPGLDHGILSPSGKVSKRAREAALERAARDIFGPEGLRPEPPKMESEIENLERRAATLRGLAQRGMKPKAYRAEADALEAEAMRLRREASPQAQMRRDLEKEYGLESPDQPLLAGPNARFPQKPAEPIEFSPDASERQRALEEQDAAARAAEEAKLKAAEEAKLARPKIEGKQVGLFGEEDRGRRLDQMDLFRDRQKRYGAGDGQKNLFDQIEGAAKEPDRILSGGGALPLSGDSAFDRISSKTLANRIVEEYRRQERLDFAGQKVRSPEEVAVVAQIARSPFAESFRAFYVDEAGNIIDHEAISSHLPTRVYFYADDFAATIRRRMKDLGAAGYWLLHNHPSGNPIASKEDLTSTRHMARVAPGMKGHVIIDHGTYSVIDGETLQRSEALPLPPNAPEPKVWTKPHAEVGLPEGFSGRADSGRVAAFGRQLSIPERNVALIYSSSWWDVRAVQAMPIETFRDVEKASEEIRHSATRFASGNVVAYLGEGAGTGQALTPSAKQLVRLNAIQDFVYDSAESRQRGMSPAFSVRDRTNVTPDDNFYLGKYSGEYGQAEYLKETAAKYGREEGEPIIPESDVEELPKYARNINLQRLNTSDDVQRLVLSASERIAERGKTSLDDIRKAAADSPYELADAKKFAASSIRQRASWLATRQMALGMTEDFKRMQDDFRDNPTPEKADRLQRAVAPLLMGLRADMDAAHEAGLALRTFGIMAEGKVGMFRAQREVARLVDIIEKRGKGEPEIARQIAATDFTDPQAVQRLVTWLSPKAATWRDKLYEYYINSLLSAPTTHAVNNLGNIIGAVTRPLEELALGRFGAAKADAWGMVNGLGESARAFARQMRDESYMGLGKNDVSFRGPAIEGVKGQAVRVPSRLLEAEDQFWLTLNYRGSLHSQAYRLAQEEGLHGRALADRAAKLAAEPSLEMQERAWEDSKYRTWRKDLGEAGNAGLRFREKAGLRWIVPFAKVPTNLVKFAGEWSPLNLFARIPIEAARGKLRGEDLRVQIARASIGSAIAGALATYAISGKMSGGGPTDPAERRRLFEAGWQPYSFKAGNRWIPYNRLDPFSTLVGPVADFVELTKEASREKQSEIASRIVFSIARNVTSKTWLQGLSDFFDLMSVKDSSSAAEKILASYAGSLVPNAVARGTAAADEERRNPQSLTERIKMRVPGLREDVAPQRDVRGRPIPAPGTDLTGLPGLDYLARWMSPILPSAVQGGPLERQLARIGADLPKLSDKITWRGYRLALDPGDFDRYQQIVGGLVDARFKRIEDEMRSFDRWPDEKQRKIVLGIVRHAHDTGRQQMIRELVRDGKLKDLVATAKTEAERKGERTSYFGPEEDEAAAGE